jgi:hypothetical protein
VLRDCLEVVSLEPSEQGAIGVRDFVETLLTRRVKPRLVVDETGFAPQLRLILELLHLNGVPILSTSEADRDFLYAGGIADWRSSCLFDRLREPHMTGRVPDGYQSIWDVMRPRIVSLEEAGRRLPSTTPEGGISSPGKVLGENVQLGAGLLT